MGLPQGKSWHRSSAWSIPATAWLWCFSSLASGDAPVLSYLFPAGTQRGAEVIVTCHGKFSWPVKVWAPGVEIAATAEMGTLKISVPKNLAADRVWIRLYDKEGASAPVPFLIGSLRETLEVEPNDSARTAQKLSEFGLPSGDTEVTINGVLQKNDDVDGFELRLTRGQTLVAAVAANAQFGSPMDSILQVVSPDGTVLAENHDDVGLDPRLAFIVAESGTYVVRLFAFPSQPDQRIQFRGGDNYVYRLTLTTGPYITHAVPMTATLESPGATEVLGWNIPPDTRLSVVPFDEAITELLPEFEAIGAAGTAQSQIGFVRAPNWAGAARVRLVSHCVKPIMAEATEQQPLELSPPNAVSGCIRTPGQTDFFHLPFKKNQQIVLTVESLRLDSPLVPLVTLRSPDGKIVEQVLESGAENDVSLTHNVVHDGDYLLTVRDRYRHGGQRYIYRLTVRPQKTEFGLSMETDAIVLTPKKPVEIPVNINRYAALGEAIKDITIEALDLPDGIVSTAVVSEPKGDTAKKVSLKFETQGTPFSGPIRIRGTCVEHNLQRFALTPTKFKASFDRIWLTVAEKRREGS